MKKVFMTVFAAALAMGMSAGVTPNFGLEFGYDHGSIRAVEEDVPAELLQEEIDMYKMDGFHVGGNVQLDFMDGPHIPSLIIGLNYQFLNNNLYNTNDDMKKAKEEAVAAFEKLQEEADGKLSDLVLKADLTMHTIQMPIRAQYAYQINSDWRVFAYTGPQLRFHIAMTQSREESMKYDGKKTGAKEMSNYISGKEKMVEWADGKEASETFIPNFSKGTAKVITVIDGEKETKEIDIEKEGKDNLMQWFDMSWGFGVGCAWKNLSLNISYDLGMLNLATTNAQKRAKELDKKLYMNSDALAVTVGYRF